MTTTEDTHRGARAFVPGLCRGRCAAASAQSALVGGLWRARLAV
jgi:hypothetical protein